MQRRHFIGLAFGSALAAPRLVVAQQKPVIGFLNSRSPGEAQHLVRAFHEGLKEAGFVEGRNVAVEYRWAEGSYERLKGLAADLVTRKVSVLTATGGTVSALAARDSTNSIPVVFSSGGDPVKLGLVASLNRPGGNVTGASQLATTVAGKNLELIATVIPAGAIGVLTNSRTPLFEAYKTELEAAARFLGRALRIASAGTDDEIERAVSELTRAECKALVVTADPFLDGRRARVVAAIGRHALPAAYGWRDYVELGGLMSYGTDARDAYRLVGVYAGRILKGEKPAEMPVQAAKVELVINRKAAKALGITIPQNLLLRADKVID